MKKFLFVNFLFQSFMSIAQKDTVTSNFQYSVGTSTSFVLGQMDDIDIKNLGIDITVTLKYKKHNVISAGYNIYWLSVLGLSFQYKYL